MKILIKDGIIVNEGRSFEGDLLVDDEQISEIYEGEAPRGVCDRVIDASGCFVCQVSLTIMFIFVNRA